MKITLCIDKQSRDNPSSELRQYSIDIGCPLRSYGEFFDELKISTDDTNNLIGVIIRRCYVDKYGVLKKLEVEETQQLEIPEITLFEGTNYVYIQQFTNLNMKIEYLTNAEMNKYFATKAEMNSSIKQTYDSILLSVSTKADKTELQSAISILSDAIALRVIKGDVVNEFNISDELISIIGNRLEIDTDNLNLTKTGILTCVGAILKNVTIGLIDDGGSNCKLELNNSEDVNVKTKYYSNAIRFQDETKDTMLEIINNISTPRINLISGEGSSLGASQTAISAFGITTPTITQTSLESKKKNFKLFNKGLELITSSDFYLYNLKTENDDDKKHIGLVIGDKYNTPTEFTNQKEDAIDLYSLISACGDAIKTLNNKVIELEKQIKEMR